MSTGAPADSNAGQARFHMFTDEQQQLRKEIREFAAREIAPNVRRWDEATEFRRAGKRAWPHGAPGRDFPAEYGGSGLGYVEYVLASKNCRGWTGRSASYVASHNSLGPIIFFSAGTKEKRRSTVTRLAAANGWARWGLTEPGSGSDASSARTTAVKKGDR